MKPCKSADYFIKVNFHVVVDTEQSESRLYSRFQLGKFFLLKYIYYDLRKKLVTNVDARLQVNVISRSLWKQVSSALAHRRKYNQEAYQRILPYANFETSEKCLLGYHRRIN